jgi:hypothetical protein
MTLVGPVKLLLSPARIRLLLPSLVSKPEPLMLPL